MSVPVTSRAHRLDAFKAEMEKRMGIRFYLSDRRQRNSRIVQPVLPPARFLESICCLIQ